MALGRHAWRSYLRCSRPERMLDSCRTLRKFEFEEIFTHETNRDNLALVHPVSDCLPNAGAKSHRDKGTGHGRSPTTKPTAEPTEEFPEIEAEAEMVKLTALAAHPWQWVSCTGPVEQFHPNKRRL